MAQEWGLDYPYVPEKIMETVEASRDQWEGDLIWDYLHVPKPQRTSDHEMCVRFQDIFREWRQGRAIYKDRVLVQQLGQHMKSYSISVRGEGDTRKKTAGPPVLLVVWSHSDAGKSLGLQVGSRVRVGFPIDCQYRITA